jgi:hypothetical protein
MSSPSTTVLLTNYVYAPEAVYRAIEIFSRYCLVHLVHVDGGMSVTLTALADSPLSVADEFLNHTLNFSVEQHLTEA